MKNIVIAASMLIALSGCAQQPHTPNFSFDGLVYQEIEGSGKRQQDTGIASLFKPDGRSQQAEQQGKPDAKKPVFVP